MKKQLLDTVLRLCSINTWNYKIQELDQENITQLLLETHSLAQVTAIVGEASIAFYTNYTQSVPASKFPEICEFIALVNPYRDIGNLEIDMHTGILRHKCYTVWDESTLPNVFVLEKYSVEGMNFFKNYKYGIDAMLRGELSPKAALRLYDEKSF